MAKTYYQNSNLWADNKFTQHENSQISNVESNIENLKVWLGFDYEKKKSLTFFLTLKHQNFIMFQFSMFFLITDE